MSKLEVELKLQIIDESRWNDLVDYLKGMNDIVPGSIEKSLMEARYFDTEQRLLSKMGYAFRVRKEKDGLVATLKGRGKVENGLHSTVEWNVMVDSSWPDIMVFKDEPGFEQDLIDMISPFRLQNIMETMFTREKMLLQLEDNLIEVAIDCGFVRANNHNAPIKEVELELLEGKVETVKALGSSLLDKFPLELSGKSKFARGLEISKMVL